MASRSLGDFMDSGAGAGRLMQHAALLLRLRRTAAAVLPEPLWQFTQIASYKQGKVVIFAENNAVAAKLRLLAPGLIDAWTQQGLDVSAIRIEAQARMPQKVARKDHVALSLAAAKALDDLAGKLPDTPLRETVRTLARKARR